MFMASTQTLGAARCKLLPFISLPKRAIVSSLNCSLPWLTLIRMLEMEIEMVTRHWSMPARRDMYLSCSSCLLEMMSTSTPAEESREWVLYTTDSGLWKGHVEIINLLLAKDGIDINLAYDGTTPLIAAAGRGLVEVVELFSREIITWTPTLSTRTGSMR